MAKLPVPPASENIWLLPRPIGLRRRPSRHLEEAPKDAAPVASSFEADVSGSGSVTAGEGGGITDGEGVVTVTALTSYERQKRWREKNRERYNAYMRGYRKRTKPPL